MGPYRAALVAAALVALPAPTAAIAGPTAEGHRHDDVSSLKTPEQERAMTRATKDATASDARAAALAIAGAPGEIGSWSAPVDWPVVGIHAALLPDGNVLAYDSIADASPDSPDPTLVHNFTRASVWNPVTGTHTAVWLNGFNVFCSGLAHLLDGSVFLAGGNKNAQLDGIKETHVFAPATNTWSRGADMAVERWYPTVTGQPNGDMLIAAGTGTSPYPPEVRQRDGAMRTLTNAGLSLPLYPWLDVAPDGRTFQSGPDQTMRKLDVSGAGAWEIFGQRDGFDRSYGGHAVFDVGKILVAGGELSVSDARVIDINGSTPAVSPTGAMAFGRRQHNLTLLADGTALATGGNSSGEYLLDLANGVYAAELWNPATGQWTTLAAQQITRQYHSTALLLLDGRVLSSGGGSCGQCDREGYLAKNAEIFTPPYLFKKDGSGELAPRPTIASAPATIGAGTSFAVGTPDAGAIVKAGLVRLGAVTHSLDMDQRYVPLSFTAGAGSLDVTAPANKNIAPPGPYMLFVVNAAGVPSIAKVVTVGLSDPPPTVSLTQPAAGATFDAPATVNLAASATAAAGLGITKVEFFNGAAKLGEDASAPYTYAWTGVGQGTYALTARATDTAAVSTTSAPVSITVRPSNAPPSVAITSPASGATFTRGASVTISAAASDSDGTVTKVEFFRGDATKLGEDTTAPYSIVATMPQPGNQVLRARATDNGGAVTTSAPVTIKIRK